MTTYTETVLPKADVALFRKIEKITHAFPDPNLGIRDGEVIVPSCRHLAHALTEFFPLKAVDGYSPRRGYQHSWLETANRNIIDVYPVGMVGGPLLLAADRVPDPWRFFYIEHPFDFLNGKEFEEELHLVRDALLKTIYACGIEIGTCAVLI